MLLFMGDGMSVGEVAGVTGLDARIIANMVPDVLRQLAVALGLTFDANQSEDDADEFPLGGEALGELLAGGGVNLSMFEGSLASTIAVLQEARDQRLDELRRFVERESPVHRDTFVRWFLGNSSLAIAEDLGVEHRAVKARLARTLRRLVEQLADAAQRDSDVGTESRREQPAEPAMSQELREQSELEPSAVDGSRSSVSEGSRPASESSSNKLSEREAEALRLVGNGETDQAIAAALGISEAEATVVVRDIVDKLGAGHRAVLADVARYSRISETEDDFSLLQQRLALVTINLSFSGIEKSACAKLALTQVSESDLRDLLRELERLQPLLMAKIMNGVRDVRVLYSGERAAIGSAVSDLILLVRSQQPPNTGWLSEGEVAALCLVAEGLSNKEIARALGRSVDAVKTRLMSVSTKLGVGSRAGIVVAAIRAGAIPLHSVELVGDRLSAEPVDQGSDASSESSPIQAAEPRLRGSRPDDDGPAMVDHGGLSDLEVAELCSVAEGRTNPEIAEELGLPVTTVKGHLARIGTKLGVADRAGMVVAAIRAGKIPLHGGGRDGSRSSEASAGRGSAANSEAAEPHPRGSRVGQDRPTIIDPATNPVREYALTEREIDVLILIAGGRTRDEIAAELGLAVSTVRHAHTRIVKKLDIRAPRGIRNREFLVVEARRLGIIGSPDPETTGSTSRRRAIEHGPRSDVAGVDEVPAEFGGPRGPRRDPAVFLASDENLDPSARAFDESQRGDGSTVSGALPAGVDDRSQQALSADESASATDRDRAGRREAHETGGREAAEQSTTPQSPVFAEVRAQFLLKIFSMVLAEVSDRRLAQEITRDVFAYAGPRLGAIAEGPGLADGLREIARRFMFERMRTNILATARAATGAGSAEAYQVLAGAEIALVERGLAQLRPGWRQWLIIRFRQEKSRTEAAVARRLGVCLRT